MNGTRVARNLRARIGRFSGDLSNGLCKPARRFVGEMVYGILASESVMLTDIGRKLEEDVELRKTHGRLSRNLQRSDLERAVGENLLGMASGRIDDDTLLIIDPSDISKTHAKKMEFLGRVRDGSTGQIRNGYWTLHVVGAKVGSSNIVPLYQRLWSSKAIGHVSENAEILNAVDSVMAHVGRRGMWVMDRGGDRIKLFAPMLDRGARFLFRLRGDRHVVFNGKTRLASDVALHCRCKRTKHITRIIDGKEKVTELHFGFRKVRLPNRSEQLYMLVIRGFGKRPLMLLDHRKSQRQLQKPLAHATSLPQTLGHRRHHPTHQNLLRLRERAHTQLPGIAKPHATGPRRRLLCLMRTRPRHSTARDGRLRRESRQTPLRNTRLQTLRPGRRPKQHLRPPSRPPDATKTSTTSKTNDPQPSTHDIDQFKVRFFWGKS
jgi:hypothetical protein